MSKVVRNRAELWMFWPTQILGAHTPRKLYKTSHACLAERHVEKFREVIPIGLKLLALIGRIWGQFLNVQPLNILAHFRVSRMYLHDSGAALTAPAFSVATLVLYRHWFFEC